MSKEDEVLRFLLPDILGKPIGFTDEEGSMVFPSGAEIPPHHFIFFVSVEEWRQLVKKEVK